MTTPEQRREYKRRWREKNPEYGKTWYRKNRERVMANVKRWRSENPENVKATMKRWQENNKDKFYELRKRCQFNYRDKKKIAERRRRLDPNIRLRCALSSRIRMAMKKRSCGVKTLEVLGCPMKDFIIYLESKFEVGMTWENYGKVWHVDHIMPCAIFDLTKPEHQRRCFHFSNLQPMFGRENLKKGSKITTNQYNLL